MGPVHDHAKLVDRARELRAQMTAIQSAIVQLNSNNVFLDNYAIDAAENTLSKLLDVNDVKSKISLIEQSLDQLTLFDSGDKLMSDVRRVELEYATHAQEELLAIEKMIDGVTALYDKIGNMFKVSAAFSAVLRDSCATQRQAFAELADNIAKGIKRPDSDLTSVSGDVRITGDNCLVISGKLTTEQEKLFGFDGISNVAVHPLQLNTAESTEPAKTEPAKTEPAKTESANTEDDRATTVAAAAIAAAAVCAASAVVVASSQIAADAVRNAAPMSEVYTWGQYNAADDRYYPFCKQGCKSYRPSGFVRPAGLPCIHDVYEHMPQLTARYKIENGDVFRITFTQDRSRLRLYNMDADHNILQGNSQTGYYVGEFITSAGNVRVEWRNGFNGKMWLPHVMNVAVNGVRRSFSDIMWHE